MPLHQEAKAYLENTRKWDVDPEQDHSISIARNRSNTRPYESGPTSPTSEDLLIPGKNGKIPIRIYTPPEQGPFPILVWFHGGGWVFGDLDTSDCTCRHLCLGSNCIVISVDYRLAPESKFPAAVDDCYAATNWASINSESINGLPNKLAVGGPSAGGNLAAAVALMSRDKLTPKIDLQLVMVPCLDRNFETDSYSTNAEGFGLTKKRMQWFWNHYLQNDKDAYNSYAAPLQEKNLSGLPPALVQTAEFDPLRDDGFKYHARLEEAGIKSSYKNYKGMIHMFFSVPSQIAGGQEALNDACLALKLALQPS